MKFLIFGDVHWSTYSSIVRTRGDKYSTRLINLINTINWVEKIAVEQHCDEVICLGDFFDRSDLTAEEITALNEIRWANVAHIFLVGNHEMGINNLSYSSAHCLSLIPNLTVVSSPTIISENNIELCFLPYSINSTNQSITELFPRTSLKRVIFSHNDIKGVQMGQFISKEGYDLEDIHKSCEFFFNGHLHNSTTYNNIINVGNVTGQNFSEDAMKYKHKCIIFDTDTQQIQSIINPFAFNFYKFNLTELDNKAIITLIEQTYNTNGIYSITITEEQQEFVKNLISEASSCASRFIIQRKAVESSVTGTSIIQTDHIKQFSDFVLNVLEKDDILLAELNEVCR